MHCIDFVRDMCCVGNLPKTVGWVKVLTTLPLCISFEKFGKALGGGDDPKLLRSWLVDNGHDGVIKVHLFCRIQSDVDPVCRRGVPVLYSADSCGGGLFKDFSNAYVFVLLVHLAVAHFDSPCSCGQFDMCLCTSPLRTFSMQWSPQL